MQVLVSGLEVMNLGISKEHLGLYDINQDMMIIELHWYQYYCQRHYEQLLREGHRAGSGALGEETWFSYPEGKICRSGLAGPAFHQPDRPHDLYRIQEAGVQT